MNSYKLTKHIIFCFLMLFFMSSCNKHKEEYHTVIDKIEVKSKNYKGTTISSEQLIDFKNMIEVTENEITFFIPTRKDKITSFKCTECHTKPLAKMQRKDIKKAHWNITIKHANVNTMNCITCHDGNDMNTLKSITGHKIDFNKSYQLCSQCHQQQYKDWTGGAHGKKIKSWAPPRASMTCVNCHNPHTPQIKSKFPEIFNTQKLKERK